MAMKPMSFESRVKRAGSEGFFCSIGQGVFKRLWLGQLVYCLAGTMAGADFWVTGYYPGYEQSRMRVSEIDLGPMTHIIHFAAIVKADAGLDLTSLNLNSAAAAELIQKTHLLGKKVIVCVGGAGSEAGFQSATTAAKLPTFIQGLTNLVAQRGYDGVDLDWEPLADSDASQFTQLVVSLRASLNRLSPSKLLTSAVEPFPQYGDSPTAHYSLFAQLQNQFDQLNVMTYDISGPWPGWVTWHNGCIFDGGFRFPSTGGLLPSADGSIHRFLAQGLKPGKLGLGMGFYGVVWSGGTGFTQPRQPWADNDPPKVSTETFATIATSYLRPEVYHWDTNAQAAYLSLTNGIRSQDEFISYEDERACQAKISYARNHQLGGLMIWELAQDYLPSKPQGHRHPLVGAIAQGLATPGTLSARKEAGRIWISFTAIPSGVYALEYSNDLGSHDWTTLSVTQFRDTVGTLVLPGDAVSQNVHRFYRVRTPP